jgi:hypothetical protein
MKKYLKQLQAAGLFALLVPALLLTGCNDDDNDTPGPADHRRGGKHQR